MKLTAEQLYKKLVEDYKVIGEAGSIKFTVKDLSILIKTKDSVGNLLQEWLKAWNKVPLVSTKPCLFPPVLKG